VGSLCQQLMRIAREPAQPSVGCEVRLSLLTCRIKYDNCGDTIITFYPLIIR